jgi:hypothetical protein
VRTRTMLCVVAGIAAALTTGCSSACPASAPGLVVFPAGQIPSGRVEIDGCVDGVCSTVRTDGSDDPVGLPSDAVRVGRKSSVSVKVIDDSGTVTFDGTTVAEAEPTPGGCGGEAVITLRMVGTSELVVAPIADLDGS